MDSGFESLEIVKRFHDAAGYPTPDKPVIDGLTQDVRTELRLAASMLYTVVKGLNQYLEQCAVKPAPVQRTAYMIDELREFIEAMANGDLEHACKELTDCEFVLIGSVLSLGLASIFPEAMRRLDRSNMSKRNDDGVFERDARGKTIKGKNFQPVELGDLFK